MERTRTIRLLVVEDDPAYLYLVQNAFHGHGGEFRWEVTVAADGEKALQVLFGEENAKTPLPDLILLEWNLPKVSGNEVLCRIKGHPRLLRIPVLVFSSSDEEKDIHAAYDGHANGYITKPGSPKLMADLVETIGRFWVAVAKLPKVLRSSQAGGA